MSSRVLPSVRDLLIAGLGALLALSLTNLVGSADAGIVQANPTTKVVFIATGANFPDALGAAAAAGASLSPVLLVTQNSVPQPTLDELNRLAPEEIVIVGGSGVISDSVQSTLEDLAFFPVVTRVAGQNRYETAAELSAATFPTTGLYPLAAYAIGPDDEPVGTTDEVLVSVVLPVPVDGTVIVNSSARVANGTADDYVRCSITTGTTKDNDYLQSWQSDGPGDQGSLAGTRAFDVTAGTDIQIRLVCDTVTAETGVVANSDLTAILIADL